MKIYSHSNPTQFNTFKITNIDKLLISHREVEGSKRFISDLESKQRFSDEVFQFIDSAYDELGGWHSFKDRESFINDSYLWYITYDGPEPASEMDLDIDRVYVISVYRKYCGLKLVGIAKRRLKQPGSLRIENDEVRNRADAAFAAHLRFMKNHGWAEVSDKLETWCHRVLGDSCIINPRYLIEKKILKNIEIDPSNEAYYFRRLRKDGPLIHKIAYGTPRLK